MSHHHPTFEKKDGKGLRIGIVKARWNDHFTGPLEAQAIEALKFHDVADVDIIRMEVPGAYETVFGAKQLIEHENVDAVICMAVLVKGATQHFEYISEAVTQGIMNLSLSSNVPVVYGILNCNTMDQAKERSEGPHSYGPDWGHTAVEMALLKK